MRNPAGKIHKVRDLYQDYKEYEVSYTTYRKVLSVYYSKIVDLLLTGYTWNMGHHLHSIRIQKVTRKYTKPRVDHYETRKLHQTNPQLDKSIQVYYTSTYWYRYYWNKNNVIIPNRSAYRFDVTKGITSTGILGNSRKLAKLLNTDPLAHLKFNP